ncbi:MAG: zf-HC2 domain-containing protein [Oscillospiraceae bacterium]|nr:zf-HC2 domain-containing protein [Oscillospiraceae bacterium]
MECNIVNDLLPLYIDDCCSEESAELVKKHIESCKTCNALYKRMNSPADITSVIFAPKTIGKINDWKASVLQSVLLFVSFAIITVGVALEAATPSGLMNGYWAVSLVIPATGFLLSLANWYFIRLYKSRKRFSNCSLLATLSATVCAYVWTGFHYEMNLIELFAESNFIEFFDVMQGVLFLYGIGIMLTAISCILSKVLSNRYAKMLGKD